MKREIVCGDALEVLKTLDDESVNCCVTSPPYWSLRDYGVDGQLGLEETPEEYVESIVGIFREVKRVLRGDGTVWLNLGDSYNGSGGVGGSGKQHTNQGSVDRPDNRAGWSGRLKPKDLVGIPWRVAFALQADGWWLKIGHHLVEAESDARECEGPADEGARVHLPVEQVEEVLLRP
jgi:hypothetical protein